MPKIHQEVSFAAPAAKIYSALTDSGVHSQFTGAPAEISSEEGGAFSCYGGRVVGTPSAISRRAGHACTGSRCESFWKVGRSRSEGRAAEAGLRARARSGVCSPRGSVPCASRRCA
jgi:hypothetical protein